MPSKELRIDYIAPYSLHYHIESEGVRRSFWLDGRAVVLDVEQHAPNAPIRAHAHSNESLDDIEPDLIRAARHLISADDDLADFHAAVASDERMTRLATLLPGLKPFRTPDLWTTMLRSLVSQQISGSAARSIREKLSMRFGKRVWAGAELIPVLPDAATVANASVEDLKSAGLSTRKAEYANGIARALLDGVIAPEVLATMSPDEAIARLAELRGVGVWTAECTLLFGLGERDVLPADDLGIRKAIARLYGMDAMPSPAEVRRLGKQWNGWKSYATVYLWRSLTLPENVAA
jgi:DNA-3-methyladenine glycosylase II